METGPRLKVSDRLVKPGIEPVTPGLQGKWVIHYTTAAPPIHVPYDYYTKVFCRLNVFPKFIGPVCRCVEFV